MAVLVDLCLCLFLFFFLLSFLMSAPNSSCSQPFSLNAHLRPRVFTGAERAEVKFQTACTTASCVHHFLAVNFSSRLRRGLDYTDFSFLKNFEIERSK